MARTTAIKPLTEEEQLTNALGSAIVNRDVEQLSAAINELGKRYTKDELEKFWVDIKADLTEDDIKWLTKNLMGKDVPPEPVKPLTQKERKRLEKLEASITESLRNFENLQLKVGEALTEIDANKLWRESHASFPAYCEDLIKGRHQFGYKRAKQLMSAVQVRSSVQETLEEVGDSTVVELNEWTLRELGKEKDVEKRNQILREAAATSPTITATAIKEIRERITPPATRQPSQPTDLTIEVGTLVVIDNPESPHADQWGRLDSINGKRVKVRIGTQLLVFDDDEIQLSRYVPEAIAKRVEALCKSGDDHVRHLASTFTHQHEFVQWQQDLLTFLEGIS